MTTIIVLALVAIAALYVIAIGITLNSLPWIITIGVLGFGVSAAAHTYQLTAQQRQKLTRCFTQYWYLWVPALVLATGTTLCLWIARGWGVVIPYLQWGARGTPWPYVYLVLMMWWAMVIALVSVLLNWKWRKQIGKEIGQWIRRGGFWMIFRTDNVPSNSFIALWVILATFTVAYGPPTPKIDAEKYAHQMKGYVERTWHTVQENQSADDSMTNFLSQVVLGKNIVLPANSSVDAEALGPRYERGWARIVFALALLPFVILGFATSRRDDAAEILDAIIERIPRMLRRNPSSSVRASSAPATATVAAAEASTATPPAGAPVGHDTPFSKLFASDLLSDALVAILSATKGWIKK